MSYNLHNITNELNYNSLSEDSIGLANLANFDDLTIEDYENLSKDEVLLKAFKRYNNNSFAGTWNYISTNCYTTKDGHDVAIALFRNADNKCIYPVFFDADLEPYIENLSLTGTLTCVSPQIRHNIKGIRKNIGLWSFEFMHKHSLTSYYGEIDHISLNRFDNTSLNLRNVTHRENMLNRPSQGFYKDCNGSFIVSKLNIKCKSEFEAICERAKADDFMRATSEDGACLFDFLKYRRHDNALLYDYYRGRISAEEATYRHVMQFADNAWIYYRYNLQEYFKDNHIPVPEFDLGSDGYMYSRGSHILLNPFYGSDYFDDRCLASEPSKGDKVFFPTVSDYLAYKDKCKDGFPIILEPFKYLYNYSLGYYKDLDKFFDDLQMIRNRDCKTKNQSFASRYRLIDYLETFRYNPQIMDFVLRDDNIGFANCYTPVEFLEEFRNKYSCDWIEFLYGKPLHN